MIKDILTIIGFGILLSALVVAVYGMLLKSSLP